MAMDPSAYTSMKPQKTLQRNTLTGTAPSSPYTTAERTTAARTKTTQNKEYARTQDRRWISWSRSSITTWPGFLRKKKGPNPRRPRNPKLPSAPFPKNGRSERTATMVRAMTAKLNQANFCSADTAFLPDEDGENRLNPAWRKCKVYITFCQA